MSAGKGSDPRPLSVSRREFEASFDRTFGKRRAPRHTREAFIGTGHQAGELGHTFVWRDRAPHGHDTRSAVCVDCGLSRQAALHFGWWCEVVRDPHVWMPASERLALPEAR